MLKRCFISTVVLFLFCIPCFAETVSVSINRTDDIQSNSTEAIQHIKPITITTKAATIRLTTRRTFGPSTKAAFLQGKIKTQPAAASVINGNLKLVFLGKVHGSRKSRQRLYTLKMPIKNRAGVARLSSVPASVFAHKTCGTEHKAHTTTATASIKEGMSDSMAHVVTIHTYADPEWVDIHGAAANDAILEIINEAEVVYDSQLQIRFRVVGQTLLQTRNPILNPGELLGAFRTETLSESSGADLKHLFTGKDMEGTTIGLAFVGAVCWQPDYAYGISQSYFGGGYLFAHEVGHNFGASHDNTSYGIMYKTILLWGNRTFSQISLNEINSYLSYYGSCLSLEPVPPNLRTSTLTLTRKTRTLKGALKSFRNIPIANTKIVIHINNKIVVRKTNAKGEFTYTIPKAKKRFYTIYATTENDEKESKAIWGFF